MSVPNAIKRKGRIKDVQLVCNAISRITLNVWARILILARNALYALAQWTFWKIEKMELTHTQTDFTDPFRDVLESSCTESKKLLITGDFNVFLAKPCSRVTNELKGILTNFNLSQLITKATRTTKDSSTFISLLRTVQEIYLLLKLSNIA